MRGSFLGVGIWAMAALACATFAHADSLQDSLPSMTVSSMQSMSAGTGTSFNVSIPAPADDVTLSIVKDGNVVRALHSGAVKAGDVKIAFDGKDDSGKLISKGRYGITATVFWKNNVKLVKRIPLRTDLSSVTFALDKKNNIYAVSRMGAGGDQAITAYYAPAYEKSEVLAEGLASSTDDPTVPNLLNGCYALEVSPDSANIYMANNLFASPQQVERHSLKRGSLEKEINGKTDAMAHPWAMALSADGKKLYVADQGWSDLKSGKCGAQVLFFDTSSMDPNRAGYFYQNKALITKTAGGYKLSEIYNIKLGMDGAVYLLAVDSRYAATYGTPEYSKHLQLYRFASNGTADESFASPVLPSAADMCLDAAGNIYVVTSNVQLGDSSNYYGQLAKLSPNGETVMKLDKYNNGYLHAGSTCCVRAGADGNIYLLTSNEVWVLAISSESTFNLEVK